MTSRESTPRSHPCSTRPDDSHPRGIPRVPQNSAGQDHNATRLGQHARAWTPPRSSLQSGAPQQASPRTPTPLPEASHQVVPQSGPSRSKHSHTGHRAERPVVSRSTTPQAEASHASSSHLTITRHGATLESVARSVSQLEASHAVMQPPRAPSDVSDESMRRDLPIRGTPSPESPTSDVDVKKLARNWPFTAWSAKDITLLHEVMKKIGKEKIGKEQPDVDWAYVTEQLKAGGVSQDVIHDIAKKRADKAGRLDLYDKLRRCVLELSKQSKATEKALELIKSSRKKIRYAARSSASRGSMPAAQKWSTYQKTRLVDNRLVCEMVAGTDISQRIWLTA